MLPVGVRTAFPGDAFVSNVLSQPRHERHPVGLLIVIGLHVLLALVMLSAKLRIDSTSFVQAALTKIEQPPQRQQAPSQELPDVPRTSLRQIVAPVPEVVVDHPDAIQAAPVAAPPGPEQAQTQAESTAPAPAPAQGPNLPGTVGEDNGAPVRVTRIEPRPARVYIDAPQCQPEYPPTARLHNVAGTTRLRFTLDATGQIVGVKLLGRSGDAHENYLLDQAAMESLSHCPARVGIDESGHPVGGTADVNYFWHIY
jgi:periplasmic protein TonB